MQPLSQIGLFKGPRMVRCLPTLAGAGLGMWFVTEQCGCKVRQVLSLAALSSLAGGQAARAQLILWLQRGQGSNLNYSSPFQNDRVTWSLVQAHSQPGHCIQPLLPPVPLCSPMAAAALPALGLTNVCVFLTGHPIPLNLHESSRSGLQRLASISNPPPLISSTKHPSVLERSVGSISQVGC